MRRALAGLLGPLVVAALAPAAVAGPDETTNFRVNPRKDNAVEASTLRPPLRLRWQVLRGNTMSNVIVAGGRVFYVNFDNVKAEISALDAATGAVLWVAPAGPGSRGWALAYENGRLVVSRISWSHEDSGRIWAIDAATGATVWTRTLTEAYGISSEPTVTDGVVYVAAGDGSTTLYALRLSDGTEIWKSGWVAGGSYSSPAVDEISVYTAWGGGHVFSHARDTGATRWHYQGCCSGGGGSTVVLHGGLAFEQSDGNLIHEAATGRVVGSFPGWSGGGALPAFGGDLALYIDAGLSAVDPGGREVWKYVPFDPYDYPSWPVVAGGNVYVREGDSFLTAVDLATGKPTWCGAFTPPPGSQDAGVSVPYIGNGILVIPVGYALLALEGGGSGTGCPGPTGGPGSDPSSGTVVGGAGARVTVGAPREDVLVRRRTVITGTAPAGSTVTLEADPHPFGRYRKLLTVVAKPDGTFTARFRPARNTRIRAKAADHVSDPVTIYADFPLRVRRSGRTLGVIITAPRGAPIARRRMNFYRADGKLWRRVASRRLRRAGRTLRTQARYPKVIRRSTRYLVCTLEPRSDGYGRPHPLDPRCGRLTLPRVAQPAVAARAH